MIDRRWKSPAVACLFTLAAAACSDAQAPQTPSPAPQTPSPAPQTLSPAPSQSTTACSVTVEPTVGAPGGWGFAVGAGFKPGEKLTFTAASEDGSISGSFDSDAVEQLRPDDRGGFGLGLGAADEASVGHTFSATISSATCSAKANWRIAASNEQTAPLPTSQPGPCSSERTGIDRVDDSDEHQVHVIYAVPMGSTDRSFDTNGQIATAFDHIDTFLRERLDGHAFRLDTCDGVLDVTYLEMPRTAAEYAAMRNGFAQGLALDLARKGFRYGNKLFVVVWDGLAQWARLDEGCGGETSYYGVSTLFTRTITGDACKLPGVDMPIGEADTGIAHEIIHALGLPAGCGTTVDEGGHVTDEPTDLMFGRGHDFPDVIDAGNDDYYAHDLADCPDLADSSFLDPLPANPQLPVGWPTD